MAVPFVDLKAIHVDRSVSVRLHGGQGPHGQSYELKQWEEAFKKNQKEVTDGVVVVQFTVRAASQSQVNRCLTASESVY